jgi:hypothetical protein
MTTAITTTPPITTPTIPPAWSGLGFGGVEDDIFVVEDVVIELVDELVELADWVIVLVDGAVELLDEVVELLNEVVELLDEVVETGCVISALDVIGIISVVAWPSSVVVMVVCLKFSNAIILHSPILRIHQVDKEDQPEHNWSTLHCHTNCAR